MIFTLQFSQNSKINHSPPAPPRQTSNQVFHPTHISCSLFKFGNLKCNHYYQSNPSSKHIRVAAPTSGRRRMAPLPINRWFGLAVVYSHGKRVKTRILLFSNLALSCVPRNTKDFVRNCTRAQQNKTIDNMLQKGGFKLLFSKP